MVRITSGTSGAHLRIFLSLPRCSLLESLLSSPPSLQRRPALTIAPLASLLCSAHVGKSANDATPLLATNPTWRGIVSSSVSASVQNILVDPSQPPSSPRKKELQRMRNTGGSPWLRVRNRLWRSSGGTYVTILDTMIDFGFVISSFVPLVLFWMWALLLFTFWEPQCSSFGIHRFGNNHLRAVWRLSLGLGVIPALAVLIWRLNMQNPSHYRKNSMRDTRIPYWLVIRRYWVNLLAISLTWFIYDFITCVCFRVYIVVRYSG